MRIVFVVKRYHTNMIPMVRSLKAHGCAVIIICSHRESAEDYSDTEPVFIQESPLTFKYARSLLRELEVDLLVMRFCENGFWKLSFIAKLMGISTVFYDQVPCARDSGFLGYLRDGKNLCVRMIRTASLRRITPVESPDGLKKSWFSYFFSYPISIGEKSISRGYSKSSPTVLCVGKLAQPRKRHLWLLQAIEELGVECHVILIGAGNDVDLAPKKRSLQYYRQILEFGNTNQNVFKVDILPDIPYRNMAYYYLNADVFVLPSEKEPFAISPLEAMACGCAVLAADKNGSSSLISDGEDGFLFEEQSFSDFKKKLNLLLSSPDIVKKIGTEASNTIRTRHTYRAFYNFIKSLDRKKS